MFFIKKSPTEQKGLYCTWVRQNGQPGAPLVAVWSDPAMDAFKREATRESMAAETLLASEDGEEQIGSAPHPQGSTALGDWWRSAVRGLAAVFSQSREITYSDDVEHTDRVEVHALLTSTGRQSLLLEQIVSRLSLEPGVSGVSWDRGRARVKNRISAERQKLQNG